MSEYCVLFPDGDRTYVTAGSPREAIGMVVDGRHSYTRSAGVYTVVQSGRPEPDDEHLVMFQFEPARITQL